MKKKLPLYFVGVLIWLTIVALLELAFEGTNSLTPRFWIYNTATALAWVVLMYYLSNGGKGVTKETYKQLQEKKKLAAQQL